MMRPIHNRKPSRDQIRYRLHTSIQAAAYLADNASEEDISRELQQITGRASAAGQQAVTAEPEAAADGRDELLSYHRMMRRYSVPLFTVAVVGVLISVFVYPTGGEILLVPATIAAAAAAELVTWAVTWLPPRRRAAITLAVAEEATARLHAEEMTRAAAIRHANADTVLRGAKPTGAGSARSTGRRHWRTAGLALTLLSVPPVLGAFNPLLGGISFLGELALGLVVMGTALFGSRAVSDRVFRLLRWVCDRPEPSTPPGKTTSAQARSATLRLPGPRTPTVAGGPGSARPGLIVPTPCSVLTMLAAYYR